MKRTLSFMVMALALLLTQCRKPEVKFPSPVAPEGTTVSMTVTAGPGSKTDITAAGAITWSEGDKFYVGFNGKYVGYLTLTSGQNTPTGWFSGNVTLPTGTENGEQPFHFFYLGRDNGVVPSLNATTVDVSFATQEIYADANNKLVNASKHHVGYGSAKGIVAGSEVTGINVTLVSKVALARFSFKKSGTSEGYSGVLTLSGEHIYNSMKVNFGGTFTGETTGGGEISLTNTTVSEKYVMLVPPATAVKETLEFGGEYEGVTELAQGIEANKYYGQGGPIEVVLTKVPVPVTGVTVAPTELNLVVGGTSTLTATVAPADATNKDVTWSSDDTGVATVSTEGKVTAVAAGEATITVTTVDGDMTAKCEVTVTAAPKPKFTVGKDGSGNPITVEFSKGNLYWDGSAFRFEENQWSCASTWNASYVSHFFWSKTASVAYAESYSYESASTTDVFFTNSSSFHVDGETEGTWRTLSKAEWDYLLSTRANASSLRAWKELDSGAHNGLVILPDGTEDPETVMESITSTSHLATYSAVFLPAAGYRLGTGVYIVGSLGNYWSSTPHEVFDGAYYMYFNSDRVGTNFNDGRGLGDAVRLVR